MGQYNPESASEITIFFDILPDSTEITDIHINGGQINDRLFFLLLQHCGNDWISEIENMLKMSVPYGD